MIQLTKYTPQIVINLEPGIYVFPNSSADGKTYLAMRLRQLHDDERVDSYTFVDRSHFGIEKVLDSSKNDVVLIDRYDMYLGEGAGAIEQFSKTGVVLIDCKSRNLPFGGKECVLLMDEGRLTVL